MTNDRSIPRRLPRRVRLLPVLLLAALLLAATATAGCASDEPTKPFDPASVKRPEVLKPEDDPRVQEHIPQMQRVEALLTRWDALRADGRNPEAEVLEPRLRQEVDGDFDTFARASRGDLGPHAQYLSVSALGFSGRPDATRLLVERVVDRDARLASNALIALGVRGDPATPLEPILARTAPGMPVLVRRNAPFALAGVLDAAARAGRPVGAAQEQVVLARLGTVVVDHDPITRLHVAKALGVLRGPGAFEYLRVLAGDPTMRVRWAAAAALERRGDFAGFPEVVRLLADVAADSRPVIRDVLVSYGGKLQGRALTPQEIESLGTGPRAWTQWYNHVKKARDTAAPAPRR